MVVDNVVVLFGAATFENGGKGRRAFMLRVCVFRLIGVISRLGCGAPYIIINMRYCSNSQQVKPAPSAHN